MSRPTPNRCSSPPAGFTPDPGAAPADAAGAYQARVRAEIARSPEARSRLRQLITEVQG